MQIEPPRPEHLVLEPVPLLMPDERRLVDALGQDEHAPRWQRDAAKAEGSQEPADDVGRGAGGHVCVPTTVPSVSLVGSMVLVLNRKI